MCSVYCFRIPWLVLGTAMSLEKLLAPTSAISPMRHMHTGEANPEDPWLQYGTDHDEATALYAENNYNANSAGDSEGSLYDGLNVYVRVGNTT